MPDSKPIDRERLLERFLRYARIDSAADPNTQDYPSSPGQWELGKLLAQELQQMGLDDAHQDAHGLVWATLPATAQGQQPTILFNAHLDTSPEAPSADVRPQVIESYAGGDISLARDQQVIRAETCPALLQLQGHTLVTTDGSTLLGGDDKAGVAAIMELAQHLLDNPQIPHGPVRVLFTCDEEIGRGAQHVDLRKAGATAGYTLDGGGHAEVEGENFSADQIVVKAIGNNIHPSIGKGRMVNAVRGMSQLVAALPQDTLSPESTEGTEGFLHPYAIEGGVGSALASILLRDFETAKLDAYETRVRDAADQVAQQIPGLRFEITRQRQYRNMADAIRKSPQVIEYAMQAFVQMGLRPRQGAIRGGTDGAVFSEMGLPTPNLSVGQHNIHSVLEFVSLDEMTLAVRHAVELLQLWQSHGR